MQNPAATTSSNEFPKPGDLVWAKLQGYPYWPAQVVPVETAPKKVIKSEHSASAILVRFFDEPYTFGWLEGKDLQPFRAHYEERIAAETKKTKKWRRALQMAEECEQRGGRLDETKAPSSNGNTTHSDDDDMSASRSSEDADNDDEEEGVKTDNRTDTKKSRHNNKHKKSHREKKERKKHKHKHKHKHEKNKQRHKKDEENLEIKESKEQNVSTGRGNEFEVFAKEQTEQNETNKTAQKRKYEVTEKTDRESEQKAKRLKRGCPTVEHLTKLEQYLRLALRKDVCLAILHAITRTSSSLQTRLLCDAHRTLP
jgi:hypothetical protein